MAWGRKRPCCHGRILVQSRLLSHTIYQHPAEAAEARNMSKHLLCHTRYQQQAWWLHWPLTSFLYQSLDWGQSRWWAMSDPYCRIFPQVSKSFEKWAMSDPSMSDPYFKSANLSMIIQNLSSSFMRHSSQVNSVLGLVECVGKTTNDVKRDR